MVVRQLVIKYKANGERKAAVALTRQVHAPDLDGRVNLVGQIMTDKEVFAVYSSPVDGSCFYYSFSYMVQPLLQAETSSPKALKHQQWQTKGEFGKVIRCYI